MFKNRLSLLRCVVVCVFVVGLCGGFVLQANDAYARVSLEQLLAEIEALQSENAAQQAEIDANTNMINTIVDEHFNQNCPAGQAVTGLDADGGIVCEEFAPPTQSATYWGPIHTFNGMDSEHFITQGSCSVGSLAENAEYFCQSFYGPNCHVEPGYIAHTTPYLTYPKMHKVIGCTSRGSDIPGTDCSGVPCKIGNWSENTNGVGNMVCRCD